MYIYIYRYSHIHLIIHSFFATLLIQLYIVYGVYTIVINIQIFIILTMDYMIINDNIFLFDDKLLIILQEATGPLRGYLSKRANCKGVTIVLNYIREIL